MFAISRDFCVHLVFHHGTDEPTSEQQGHTVVDAATHSTTHLVQASLRHGSSRGCDRMFERTRVGTSTHSGQTDCFGFLMVGRAHVLV